jgi:glycosyltransferase involved in cell wall biosynthesis
MPGTIRYTEADLHRLVDPATGDLRPLLMYVGRFTAVKRIPLLLRAYARARPRFGTPASLVLWGGHPGELEGEHPRAVAARLGLDDVFFVGWRGHDELPLGLAAADLLLMPSVKESFGQTAIEAMACGVPVVATRSGGPPSFINTEPGRPTGWLVEPDDEEQLTDVLVEAVNRPDERRRRGERSLAVARARFSWASLVPRFAAVYDDLREGGVDVRPERA